MNILILSAFPEEQKYYKSKLKILDDSKTIGFIKVTVCQIDSATIYLALTGMGTINASLIIATLATSLKPDAIFFSGTSGAIQNTLNIGDIVIAEQILGADIFSIHDAVKGTPFESALINPNTDQKTPLFYSADPALLGISKKITSRKFAIHYGIIATSNHFPSPKELFDDIKSKNAMAIDMESAALYQYSWLSKVPSLVVRGVSNALDENGEDKQVAQSDIHCSDHAAEVVLECINAFTK